MGAIVIRTRYDEGTESAEVATSGSSSASKSVKIFWAELYWGRLFLGPNLVSFNRAVVPLFELSFFTKFQKLTSA